MFSSVEDCLESHRRGRPQSFKELCGEVVKSRAGVNVELSKLIFLGRVHVVSVFFNGRKVPFYTVRDDVRVECVCSEL